MELTVQKLIEIAAVLEVDITYFFDREENAAAKPAAQTGGFVSKNDIDVLTRSINKMKDEIGGIEGGFGREREKIGC